MLLNKKGNNDVPIRKSMVNIESGELQRVLENSICHLNNFDSCCSDRGLKINPSKSVALLIGSDRIRKNIMYQLRVNNEKNVGMLGKKLGF